MFVGILAGAGTTVALAVAIYGLQRRFLFVRRLAFALYVAALAAGLKIVTQVQPDLAAVNLALYWALLFLPAVIVLRLIGYAWFDVHLRAHRNIQFPGLLEAVTLGIVYLVAAFATLRVVYPAWDFGPLLATSAISSLVLGLAVQPLLGNLFAGLVISLEKPFSINHTIKVGEISGTVVAINWHSTHLRTADDDELIVPNSRIAGQPVLNYSTPHPMRVERIRIAADAAVPPYRVKRVLLDCAAGTPGALDTPSPDAAVASFEEVGITYELKVWVEGVAQGTSVAAAIRAKAWEAFRKHHIPMARPSRIVEVRNPTAPASGVPQRGRLFVIDGAEAGRTLPLSGQVAVVGHQPTCALPLADPQVSKEHFRLDCTPAGYVLTDMQSTFGTRVNGAPVSSIRLADLDRIEVGGTTMVFEFDEQ
jgi:small-conductance mechanosensitive channel